MTKAAAIQKFWGSFGLTAFEENSVPTGDDAPKFPYLTYSFSEGSFGDEIPMTASLWYRSTSWVDCNAKSQEISAFLGNGDVFLVLDNYTREWKILRVSDGYPTIEQRKLLVRSFENGKIWVKKGTPFAQNMSDPSDEFIKRKYINIMVEYLTRF